MGSMPVGSGVQKQLKETTKTSADTVSKKKDTSSASTMQPATTQATRPAAERKLHDLLSDDEALWERFLNIMMTRVDAGEEPEAVVNEAMSANRLDQWCVRQEGIAWLPLIPNPPRMDRGK
eukprot:792581-Rhodomonas_salina.1